MVFGDALTEFTEDPSRIIFNGNSDSVTGSEDDDAEESVDCPDIMVDASGNTANYDSSNGASVGTVKNFKVKRGDKYSKGQNKYRRYHYSFNKVKGASGYIVVYMCPQKSTFTALVTNGSKIYQVFGKTFNGKTAYLRVCAFVKSGKKYYMGPWTTKSFKVKY